MDAIVGCFKQTCGNKLTSNQQTLAESHWTVTVDSLISSTSPSNHAWLFFVGFLASSQYPEGAATGQLGTGFSWFPFV
jgi:hypothetical protein